MGERKWITREDIAQIHDQIVTIALDQGDFSHALEHQNTAETIREIDKVGRR